MFSFRFRKFLGCTSPQIANPQIVMTNPQIANPQIFTKYCTTLSQNSSKGRRFKTNFHLVLLIRAYCATFLMTRSMYLRKSADHKKDWARKSQIRKVLHLRKLRKSNQLYKSANLRICDLRNLFAD